MAAPVMPVSLSVSQFLLFFDCFYSGGGASRQERQSLSFFGDQEWRKTKNRGFDGDCHRVTEFAEDGQSLPKIAEVFDGKMCDVGLHHRPRAAFTLTRLRLDGER
jgi:hypothetical protein